MIKENVKRFWLKYEKLNESKRKKFLDSNLKIKFMNEKNKLNVIDEILQDYKKFKEEVYFY
jgi:hypothetical protein